MTKSVWRILIAIFGICAITWAIDVIPIYRAEALLAGAGQPILSGDRFNAAQLGAMKRELDAARPRPVQASAASGAAVIRLLLFEDELKAGNRQPSDAEISDLQKSVSAVLAQSPADSFMWLTEFTLQRRRGADNVNSLRMSYQSGPNEAWIAVRRLPLALDVFQSLPSDLAEQTLSEFAGLVRSGRYADAANILAGPGWVVKEQLLSRLVRVEEADRRKFAMVLESKNLDGAIVPGISKRPARPF
jgi:hypothetical protein